RYSAGPDPNSRVFRIDAIPPRCSRTSRSLQASSAGPVGGAVAEGDGPVSEIAGMTPPSKTHPSRISPCAWIRTRAFNLAGRAVVPDATAIRKFFSVTFSAHNLRGRSLITICAGLSLSPTIVSAPTQVMSDADQVSPPTRRITPCGSGAGSARLADDSND